MGMYTEIFVNVDLKKGVPEDVLGTLRVMTGEGAFDEENWEYPSLWTMLFSDCSYYTPRTSCAELKWDEIAGCHSLIGKGDIKNYGGEIQAFFEWIAPHVAAYKDERTFIGYMRYEEAEVPTLVFLDGRNTLVYETVTHGDDQ